MKLEIKKYMEDEDEFQKKKERKRKLSDEIK